MKNIIKKAKRIRRIEQKIMKLYEQGKTTAPIYPSIGQEMAPAVISEYFKADKVFAQHRAIGWAIAYGMKEKDLIKQVTGRVGNECIYSDKLMGHHGLLGEQVPLAVGYAQATGKPTLCVMGDGGLEEDYALAAILYAITHKLPVLFIVDDNNLAILTEKDVRRSWDVELFKDLMPVASLPDNPYLIAPFVRQFRYDLPAMINIKSIRHHWHSGVGQDKKPEYDRLEKYGYEGDKYK